MRISGLRVGPYTLRNVMDGGSWCQSVCRNVAYPHPSKISGKSDQAIDHGIQIALAGINCYTQLKN